MLASTYLKAALKVNQQNIKLIFINYIFFSISIDYLKGKTCILVTHQLQYLTNVDEIVLIENVCIG